MDISQAGATRPSLLEMYGAGSRYGCERKTMKLRDRQEFSAEHDFAGAIIFAMRLLNAHGFISDNERRRIWNRIAKNDELRDEIEARSVEMREKKP